VSVGTISRRKTDIKNLSHFQPFWDIEKQTFLLFFKTFAGVVKTDFYVSVATILRKSFFLDKLFFLSFLDIERKNFGFLAKLFRLGCQNCILFAHSSILCNFLMAKSFLSHHFWYIDENKSALPPKKLGHVVKTDF